MNKKKLFTRHHPQRSFSPKGHWLWGLHTCRAALQNKKRHCHELFVTQSALQGISIPIEAIKCPVKIVTADKFEEILPSLSVHQGIALRTESLIYPALEEFCPTLPPSSIFVIFDQITDPHNIGAILRTAAALGAAGIIMTDKNSPLLSGTLAKTASGALEKLPIFKVTNLVRTLEQLKEYGFWIAGLDETGTHNIKDANLPKKIGLVLGAEGEGLRRLTKEKCDFLLKISTSPEFPTLNVSVAAAISLYELVR